MKLSIRKIRPEDDRSVASVIRTVMPEFGAVGSGFSIEDPEVDGMSSAYEDAGSVFYVVVAGKKVVGCGGVGPLVGAENDICELKKMYFLEEARGQGAGRVLGELLVNEARSLGYRQIYIETLERMDAANALYQKLGFTAINSPLGATGHCGCDRYYLLELPPADEISFGT